MQLKWSFQGEVKIKLNSQFKKLGELTVNPKEVEREIFKACMKIKGHKK